MSNFALNRKQLDRLANILDNAGQVYLAGMVIPFAITKTFNSTYIFGITTPLFLWTLSLILERMEVK